MSCHIPPFLILRSIIEFVSFICVCILVGLSKNDPFENHAIGNLTKYFKNEAFQDNTTFIIKSAYNIRNSSYYSNNYNIKKIQIRKLVSESFCYDIHDNFIRFKGKKLSSIFDLNYNKIHKLSIIDMTISCIMFGSIIIFICIILFNIEKCLLWPIIVCFFGLCFYLGLIGRFILSFLIFYYMEKGDLEKYDNFLECKNVKSKFFKRISNITRFRNCFYVFIVLNVISLGIEKLEKLNEYIKEKHENNLNIPAKQAENNTTNIPSST